MGKLKRRSNSNRSQMKTASGLEITIQKPLRGQIRIVDIALGLSRVVRFAGQTPKIALSVAAHSVFVSRLLEKMGAPLEEQLQGLLHDAAEAFYADLPSPVKRLTSGYEKLEEKLQRAIFRRFRVRTKMSPRVWIADDLALEFERFITWGVPIPEWAREMLTSVDLRLAKALYESKSIRSLFLARFEDLYARLLEEKNETWFPFDA